MSNPPSYAAKWKWCALASLAMVFLSLLPQIHFWIVRGRDWNGAYISLQGDEPFYSGYINALIDGRPRKNDPTGGRDDAPAAPLGESTFSIQFIPAYAISVLARALHASASTAMIVLLAVAGLLASLAIFWLLDCTTGDRRLAAVGVLFVLCLAGIAGGHGLLGLLLKTDLSIPSLAFLRRYQPAAAFPLFFVFNQLIWQALTTSNRVAARVRALIAGFCLSLLVFSYLYLWTAAGAWLLCLGGLWLGFRPSEWRRLVFVLTTVGAVTAIALAPYFYLVSHRAPTLDEQQTFGVSHGPDLLRIPEIIGGLILVALVLAVWRKKVERTDTLTIFAASLALLPFVVFNQQILTGKTMQPYHYEAFILNYCVLVALLITVSLLWKPLPRRVLLWVAALSFSWGVVEVGLPSRINTLPMARVHDQAIPVLRRLKELSAADGTAAGLRTEGRASALVFSPELLVTVFLPTWTSQGALLDMGGLDFGTTSRDERREFFYMHLYYSNANLEALRNALKGTPDDPSMNYYARSVIFGHGRIVPALSLEFKPIETDEIEQEIRKYEIYANFFSREQARKRRLTYAITRADGNFNFTNVDRWYERDGGEQFGAYMLYRLKLRE